METLPAIADGQLYAVLITSARLGTRLLDDTKETFDANAISRFDTVVPMRERIRIAYGQCPPHDPAYADVDAQAYAGATGAPVEQLRPGRDSRRLP